MGKQTAKSQTAKETAETKKNAEAKAAASAPSTSNEANAINASATNDIKPSTTYLEVISKQDGFRRAGLIWSTAATRIKATDLDHAQWAALLADPMLSVKEVEI